MSVNRHGLRLSDDAWQFLAMLAMGLKWIRNINTVDHPGYATRHIYRFIAAISSLKYEDARDEEEKGTVIWFNGDRQLLRNLRLDPDVLKNFTKIAVEHRILPKIVQYHVARGRMKPVITTHEYCGYLISHATSELALTAAVLEAIGSRRLVPSKTTPFPEAPSKLFSRQPKSVNLVDRQMERYIG